MIEPQPIRILKQILRACPFINWLFWDIVKDRMKSVRKGQAIKDTAVDLANLMKSIKLSKE